MPKMIRKNCAISTEGEKLLENAITRLGLSARARERILKVARRAISAKPSSTERSIAPTGPETRLRHLSTRASQVALGRRCPLALQSILFMWELAGLLH